MASGGSDLGVWKCFFGGTEMVFGVQKWFGGTEMVFNDYKSQPLMPLFITLIL